MAKSKSDGKHTELLKLAKKRYELALDNDRENLARAWEDVRFYAGEQWSQGDISQREADNRPCLTLNQLPRFVRQVTGDIRMSKPGIRVSPVDDNSDPETAQVIEGIIRQIENAPDGRAAYFFGADSQVIAGVGHWRVLADYCDDDTFDQDLRLLPIRNGLGVLWDPAADLPTREDANYCFVPEEIPIDDFKERYPEASTESVDGTDTSGGAQWFTSEKVRIAEYWLKVPKKRTLAKLGDGRVIELTEDAQEDPANIVKTVERESFEVVRYLISGAEVLEGPTKWPGRYIPIVRIAGEEIQLENGTIRKGLVRNAKDAQRLYNFWRTAQTEFVALQPKVPFIGTHKNFEKNQADWEAANKVPLPYLAYEPDPSNGGALPRRAEPPVNSTGFDAGVGFAVEDLKATTGLYDASLGERSNETSGKAIMARQREGDVATYVYFDNFSRAIAHTGRIIVDLIPHYYDTERLIRIRGEDGTEELVKANKTDIATGEVLLDLTRGKYDVVVDSGPSFTTRREEAREGLQAMLQAAGPDGLLLLGDLWAKSQDWPHADEIAKRLEQLREQQQAAGAGPDPAQAQAAAQEQMAMQLQAKQAEQQIALEAKAQEIALNLEAKQAEIAMQLQAKRGEREVENKAVADSEKQAADANGTTALAEALSVVVASAQQTNEAVTQAMAMIAQSISAPKRVVRDEAGAVIGVEVVR